MPQRTREKFITALVQGGVGNQLFIYAAARALACRTGRTLRFDIHTGYSRDDYGRSFRLGEFPGICESIAVSDPLPARYVDKARGALVRSTEKRLPLPLRNYYRERRSADASQLAGIRSIRRNLVLVGYWQDESYFSDHADTLRRQLMPPAPSAPSTLRLGQKLREGGFVMVHVRRQRYPYRLCPAYYHQALRSVRRHIDNPPICVFGDDLDWAQHQIDFGDADVWWMKGHRDLDDLWLMAQCSHGIISNSSFSWWGAWLGDSGHPASERIICAPENFGFPIKPAQHWRVFANEFEPPVGQEREASL
jgi:hypothetical protein